MVRVRMELLREEGPEYTTDPILTPTKAAEAVWPAFDGADREKAVIVALDTKKRISAVHVVAIGTLEDAPIHPREVFKAAILANAASIILAHNHPSGDLTPSSPDHGITRRLKHAGEILNIDLDDHLILGPERGRFFSMREAGLL